MLPVKGLYGHAQANTLKSILLVVGFIPAVVGAWFAVYILTGLISALPTLLFANGVDAKGHSIVLKMLVNITANGAAMASKNWMIPLIALLIWFICAFVWHESMVRYETGAHHVARFEQPRLYNAVEALAIRNGMPVPRIEIIDTQERNAYASGLSPERATIAVTRGLLDTLSDRELEAVLAHEFAHIRNHDTQLMLVITIFIGGIAVLSEAAWSVIRDRLDKVFASRRAMFVAVWFSSIILFAAIMLLSFAIVLSALYLASRLMRAAVSRAREFLADAAAVDMTGDADALVSALVSIHEKPFRPNSASAANAMMIAGLSRNWFATHPPMEARIAALQEHAGAMTPRQHMAATRRDAAKTRPAISGAPMAFGRRGTASQRAPRPLGSPTPRSARV